MSFDPLENCGKGGRRRRGPSIYRMNAILASDGSPCLACETIQNEENEEITYIPVTGREAPDYTEETGRQLYKVEAGNFLIVVVEGHRYSQYHLEFVYLVKSVKNGVITLRWISP